MIWNVPRGRRGGLELEWPPRRKKPVALYTVGLRSDAIGPVSKMYIRTVKIPRTHPQIPKYLFSNF